ncbi:glutaconate CoA-transferase subunit A [Pseudomonas protegens]|uniref:CoA transferase subunit A n=1 Tax=Pseudomonas TaxID=286 RepID=UPI00088C6F0F|nr:MULTISPECIES: CoA-transferase [Pseudomonas]MCU1765974.1 CoA transferase subunit A [Pseudomonas protegens]ROL79102.1 acyl CoA--acetate/3-ketoacid CoA transferase subunit alpha [Pseudomonas protegens]URN86593.1 MAG: CoA transferase subunit A [Pseudomonas protegens]WEK24677.1 MAG: CoA transferase subunit A [Pseudomonas protegens]SDA34873.1 glutaconate CoA-transferase subunit A [Pseudomonas sp. NFPP12]
MSQDKTLSTAQMVAQLRDGMTLGIGGWGPRRKPMALIREILRSDLKDLTVVAYGGADVGMLCAAGKIRKLVFAFVSLDFIALEPYFRKARQQGELQVMEIDEGMLLLGLRAAAMRVPFLPTAAGLGTDVLRHNPEIKLIASPYADARDWVAMPALKLDAALIHVDRADSRGLCQIGGPDHYMDDLLVRAAARTYVTCDELLERDTLHSDPGQARQVFWEPNLTSAVAHVPGGAHPSSCAPLYGFDVAHFNTYNASAQRADGWQEYRREYVDCSHQDYLDKVGGLKAIRQLPLPIF